ncbi:hypothetical protein LXA43DRAFT_1178792 [Ganoderma leucocontextum]|nr:hypothetical protein LXA43DRAFT_1178792 [Ganoderma leucocontextum]
MSDTHLSETRPAKRIRLSSNDDPSHPQGHPSAGSSSTPSSSKLQRHPEIWFNDGNIVLVAHGTAFRIYRGLLAEQSTVFSDMFASSTSSPDETFNECPVIHLSDSPHDLAHLLRVLLPTSRMHYHTTKANTTRTFDEVSAIIRLAHTVRLRNLLRRPSPAPQLALEPVHNIGAVNLARLTDTPSILPLALYGCAYLDGALFDGWTREDGTIEHLSNADLRRCADARVALAHEHHSILSRLFDHAASAACTRPDRCAAELRRLHRVAIRSDVRRTAIMDWSAGVRILERHGVLCGPCSDELLERNDSERKKIFDKLPDIFGIAVEGWGVDETETEAGPGQEDRDDG